jgi:hypothetical protein
MHLALVLNGLIPVHVMLTFALLVIPHGHQKGMIGGTKFPITGIITIASAIMAQQTHLVRIPRSGRLKAHVSEILTKRLHPH